MREKDVDADYSEHADNGVAVIAMTMTIVMMIHLPFITTTKWLISSYLRFTTQRVLTVKGFVHVNIRKSLEEELTVIEMQFVFT